MADASATGQAVRHALTSQVALVAEVADLRGATPCGHPPYRSAKCPLCLAKKHSAGRTSTCRVCHEPIDPAAGDTHPGCDIKESA